MTICDRKCYCSRRTASAAYLSLSIAGAMVLYGISILLIPLDEMLSDYQKRIVHNAIIERIRIFIAGFILSSLVLFTIRPISM